MTLKTRRGVSYVASIRFYWTNVGLEVPNDWSHDLGLSLLGRLQPPTVCFEADRRRSFPKSHESHEFGGDREGGHPREVTHRPFHAVMFVSTEHPPLHPREVANRQIATRLFDAYQRPSRVYPLVGVAHKWSLARAANPSSIGTLL